jgi:hypothetical protein
MGGIKLERFLPNNQHTQRKLLNFENLVNGGSQKFSKIRVLKVKYFHLLGKKIYQFEIMA